MKWLGHRTCVRLSRTNHNKLIWIENYGEKYLIILIIKIIKILINEVGYKVSIEVLFSPRILLKNDFVWGWHREVSDLDQ